MANELRLYQNFLGGRLTYTLPSAATLISDGVSNSTTTITSATAAFTPADVGATVTGTDIPAGAYIATYSNATTVILNTAATGTGTARSWTINRHQTIHSPAFAAMATVGTTQHMMGVLDEDGLAGEPEAFMVTLHGASSTWCQILRAQESTSLRQHAAGTDWVHGPLASDLVWSGAWTDYTPVWAGTGITQGDATIKGAYRLVGKTLHLRIHFTFGSTSAASAGGFSFSLPAGLVGKTSANTRQTLAGWVYDVSATAVYPAIGYITTGGTVMSAVVSPSGFYGGTVPVTIATGDEAHFTGTIEVD